MTITGPYGFRLYFEDDEMVEKLRCKGLSPTRQAQNDGSVPVWGMLDGEPTTILWVRPVASRKRSTAWDAPDDERDALAEKIAAALNAYEARK